MNGQVPIREDAARLRPESAGSLYCPEGAPRAASTWQPFPRAHGPHSRAPTPEAAGYWRSAWLGAASLLCIIAVRITELWPALAVVRPVVVAALVLGIVYLFTTSNQALRSAAGERQVRLMASYGVWAFLTAPFALYKTLALRESYSIFPVGLVLMLAILLCAPTRKNLDRILVGFVAAVTFLGLALLTRGTSYVSARLTTGAFYDPNDLAALLAMALPMAGGLAIRADGRHRIFGGVASAALVIVLVQTASRGGLLALAVGTIVLLAALSLSRTLVVLVIVALSGGILWEKGPPVFRERAATLLSLEQDYNVTEQTGRFQIWRRGIDYVLERPVTGVGMNNFRIAEGAYLARNSMPGRWSTAHNAYVQAFAELGLVGGCLLLTMLRLGVRQASSLWRPQSWRHRNGASLHRPELLGALLAFCTSAMFLSHAYSYLLFAILALIAFAARVARIEAGTPFVSTRSPHEPGNQHQRASPP